MCVHYTCLAPDISFHFHFTFFPSSKILAKYGKVVVIVATKSLKWKIRNQNAGGWFGCFMRKLVRIRKQGRISSQKKTFGYFGGVDVYFYR